MSLLKVIPVLPCISITKTVDFFTGKLNFNAKLAGGFIVLKRDEVEIHFFKVKDLQSFHSGSCFIITDNVEDLYTICIANDLVYPNGQITDLRYGRKEFTIRDNNGNIIRFGAQS